MGLILNPYRFAAAAGGYVADAAQFIGTGLTGGGTGMRTGSGNRISTDTRYMVMSFWFKPTSSGNGTDRVLLMIGGGYGAVRLGTDNLIQVNFKDTTNTTVITVKNSTALNSTSTWYHVCIAFDLNDATPWVYIYVNDVDDTATPTTLTQLTSSNIDWSRPQTGLWNNNANSDQQSWDGGMFDYWWDNSQSFDISNTTNRRKFIDGSGKPVDLGSDGSNPYSVQPVFFHHIDDAETAENMRDLEYGTATNSWTQFNGPLGTASDSPTD